MLRTNLTIFNPFKKPQYSYNLIIYRNTLKNISYEKANNIINDS